jgi:glycosyltransferase involved in cell wall biosynthesis
MGGSEAEDGPGEGLGGGRRSGPIELSVVLPCLNEEETVGGCIDKIRRVFSDHKINGEIIVVDNGSTDQTVPIVQSYDNSVQLLTEPERGYGATLRRGIDYARGKYVIIGDADGTYDFLEIPRFVDLLRRGYELVMGSRFRGKILPGAMSWSHRYIGNPILSGILKLFFGGNVSDSHCGLRGFNRAAYAGMGLSATGMEFASEIVMYALMRRLKIAEVPITYYPRRGKSKLSEFRDAWRHIRFMLIYSPSYLFLFPGLALFLFGLAVTLRLAFGPIQIFGRSWDVHLMVMTSMMTFLGWQVILLGIAAKSFARTISLPQRPLTRKLLSALTLERSLALGFELIILGALLFGYVFYSWARNDFGSLAQVKALLLCLTFIVMGIQTIFTSFFRSLIEVRNQ